MRIIIIGGGISSLTLHHVLLLHLPPTTTITTYESYPHPTSSTGGGLGLANNGLHVFNLISQELYDRIISNGFLCDTFELRNSRRKILGDAKARGNLMVKRSVIHDALLEGLKEHVIFGRKAVKVEETATGVLVTFEDDSQETADLVIGGDGMHSVVRQAIFPNCDAEYDGFTGIGGFIPSITIPASERQQTIMTFGPDGFFGYSPVNATEHQWWSTYNTPTPPPRSTPLSEIMPGLRLRHGDWINPSHEKVVSAILDAAEVEENEGGEGKKVLVLPNWVLPRLKRYGSESGRILLMGDAAHIMPPSSGQGVSMAVEDACTIALLLSHSLTIATSSSPSSPSPDTTATKTFPNIVEDYTKLRKARVDKVLDEAARQGSSKKKLGWVGELMRDTIIGAICRWVPESWSEWKFGYEVDVIVKNSWRGTESVV